ncbi:TerD family protein [Chryseobacterium shigense]|uniref:TerD domain-containing protein n=1 Tax=Chryseobacterium shigense TaxID=297244 RepID=A0A841N6Z5_9FLAO|nr:TerD family protein [Chryseobacterium shigense]MBB6372327.1 hypothetical protein [Chryseobacterium shigense]
MILGALNVDIKQLNKEKLEAFYLKSEELFLEYKPVIIFENINDFLDEIKNQGKTVNILSNTGFIKGRTMRKFLIQEELDQYIGFHIYYEGTPTNVREVFAKYDIANDASFKGHVAMVMGVFYKRNGEWKFNAIGGATSDRKLEQTIQTVQANYL